MRYLVSKEFRFEAAHRLTDPYYGKCAQLHGHSWIARVELAADHLDPRGFVVDFNDLHPIRQWIETHLDHATLVSSADSDLLEWLKQQRQKHFVCHQNPTSEVIAQTLYETAHRLGFAVTAVEIKETCTSTARVAGSLSTARSEDV